jgi:hypothetical protein
VIAVEEELRTTTNLAVSGDYHDRAAASPPRTFETGTTRLSRWIYFVDATRTSNCPVLFASYVVGKSVNDAIGAWWFPDYLENLAVLNPTGLWHERPEHQATLAFSCKVYRRPLLGSSSLGYSPSNSTLQAIEDSTLSSAFWNVFGSAVGEISRLGRLRRDWDSHGANPVNGAAQAAAIRFLAALFSFNVTAQPTVGPSPTGGVVLQWFVREHEVFVEVDARRIEYFAAAAGKSDLLIEGLEGVSRSDEVVRSIAPYIA